MCLALLQCPTTLRYFSTGIDLDPDTFALLPDFATPVGCPHCKKPHLFSKDKAILGNPNRWSEAPKVEDCFLKATECSEWAATARSNSRRQMYLRLEQQWIKLAHEYERIAKLNRGQGIGSR
jgi:hypothetical protein